jgi:hypothetical protein
MTVTDKIAAILIDYRESQAEPTTDKPRGPNGSKRYTQELADEICARLASGESLRSICKTEGFPHDATVYRWSLDAEHPFSKQYANARQIGYTHLAEELLEIADDGSKDYIERENKDGEPFKAVDHDHIARSRLRVDTRKWLLSKMLPKVYGDRIEHTGEDGAPIKIVMIPGYERI